MPSQRTSQLRCRDMADAELTKLYNATGVDLSMLPTVMTAEELAPAIRSSVGALAQDRYRNRGIPYIRMGRRIRYARAEVARYLIANRHEGVQDVGIRDRQRERGGAGAHPRKGPPPPRHPSPKTSTRS